MKGLGERQSRCLNLTGGPKSATSATVFPTDKTWYYSEVLLKGTGESWFCMPCFLPLCVAAVVSYLGSLCSAWKGQSEDLSVCLSICPKQHTGNKNE